jgi:hypothetical protein
MERREFIRLLGGAAAAWPFVARAQQPTTRRIAIFHPAIPTALLTETGAGSAWRAFFGELRRLGYVEGENLIIERYSAEGHHERYADLAREIVSRNPDVIVTGTNPVVIAFKAATSAIPARGAPHQPQPTWRQPHRHHPRRRDRELGEAPADTERSHPVDSKGRVSWDARGVGRFSWASRAGRRDSIGNFTGFHPSGARHSGGD